MRKVEAWKATNGTLHKTRKDAVKASLIYLMDDISDQAAVELDNRTVEYVADFMAYAPERFASLLEEIIPSTSDGQS